MSKYTTELRFICESYAGELVVKNRSIVVMGDSLTYGNKLGPSVTWINKLANFPYNMKPINMGINSSTISYIEGRNPMCVRYTTIPYADFIVISGGANDKNASVEIGDITSTDNTTFCGAINNIITGILSKYPTTNLMFMTPYNRGDVPNKLGLTTIDYVNAMVSVCNYRGVFVYNNFTDSGINLSDEALASGNAWQDEGLSMGTTATHHLSEAAYDYLLPIYANLLMGDSIAELDEDESVGFDDVDRIISLVRSKIFSFKYPIFNEEYREILETKIINHYFTREIGLETVSLWKHFLKTRMNEIMPYYNKLYEAELSVSGNPFGDVDYTRSGVNHGESEGSEILDGTVRNTGTISDDGDSTMKGTVIDDGVSATTGSVTDEGESTSADGGTEEKSTQNEPVKDTWTLYSDTPQGGIAGISAAEPSVGSNAYLTNATHVIESGVGSSQEETTDFGKTNTTFVDNTRTYDTETTNDNTRTYNTANTNDNTRTLNTTGKTDNETTRSSSSDGNYSELVKGKRGSRAYYEMMYDLSKKLVNIDMLVIRDLSDLFMNVY